MSLLGFVPRAFGVQYGAGLLFWMVPFGLWPEAPARLGVPAAAASDGGTSKAAQIPGLPNPAGGVTSEQLVKEALASNADLLSARQRVTEAQGLCASIRIAAESKP